MSNPTRILGCVGTRWERRRGSPLSVAYGFTVKSGTGVAIILETRADTSFYHMENRRIGVSHTAHLAYKHP